MSDRHGEGPEPQLRRSYPRQHSRMTPFDEPEDTEPNDQEARTDLDLSVPLDEGDQQREGKDHHEHCQQMAERQRPKCCQEARELLSISPAETASGHPIPGFTP